MLNGILNSFKTVPSNYLKGVVYAPVAIASGALVSVLGNLIGFSRDNIVNHYLADRVISPCLEGSLLAISSNKIARFINFAVFAIGSNQLVPLAEEFIFRKCIQGTIGYVSDQFASIKSSKSKPLSRKERKLAAQAPVSSFWTNARLARVAFVTTLFAALHFVNEEETGEYDVKAHVFSAFGQTIVYSYLYEKFGLAAAWGAHATNNAFDDIVSLAHPFLDISEQLKASRLCFLGRQDRIPYALFNATLSK